MAFFWAEEALTAFFRNLAHQLRAAREPGSARPGGNGKSAASATSRARQGSTSSRQSWAAPVERAGTAVFQKKSQKPGGFFKKMTFPPAGVTQLQSMGASIWLSFNSRSRLERCSPRVSSATAEVFSGRRDQFFTSCVVTLLPVAASKISFFSAGCSPVSANNCKRSRRSRRSPSVLFSIVGGRGVKQPGEFRRLARATKEADQRSNENPNKAARWKKKL